MSTTRIILAERTSGFAAMLNELLSESGPHRFEVLRVGRLDDALQLAKTEDVGAMLLDPSLPDAQGLDAIRRACASAPDLPIVVLSDRTHKDLAQHAVSVGAQDFLLKEDLQGDELKRTLVYAIERKTFERKIQHQALHDVVTGLPNRRLLLERIEQAMVRHHRHRVVFALLSIKLDQYGAIASRFEHELVNQWITALAQRLASLLRTGDTLARIDPGHFVVLMEIEEVSSVLRLVERVHAALPISECVGGQRLTTTGSTGITTSYNQNARAEHHLRDAIIATSQARAMGGGRYRVFDTPMHRRIVARAELEKDLHQAVHRNEIVPFYQPLVWLNTGEIAGFEALARWEHPERGLLSPAEFIPVAEEAGLMPAIFQRLLPRVLDQAHVWQQVRPALLININLSPTQIPQEGLLELLEYELSRAKLPPYSLGVEITENVLVEDDQVAARVLERIKDIKVRVLLDDFGVGYSALSCLHRFPIDGIKIDRSFLARLGAEQEGSAEIVRALAHLANGLGMSTTAEGIETLEQLRFVRALGCELGQGYYFGRPLDSRDAGALFEQNTPEWVSPSVSGLITVDGHSRGRVMVVSDTPSYRAELESRLEQEQYEVCLTCPSADALVQAIGEQPEVILLDLDMAGPEGIELCRSLKTSSETSNIPVLLITPRKEGDPIVLAALDAGGNDIVSTKAILPILCARLDSQISLSRSQTRLQRVSMTDEVTGVFSRRFLFGALRRAIKSTSPGMTPSRGIGVLLADIDQFRVVNDTQGHLAGDRLLSQVARAIEGSCHNTDLVARFGGQEFIVMLPDTEERETRAIADQIRQAVEVRCSNTVSIGCIYLGFATLERMREGQTLEALVETIVREAYLAMYTAKQAGRNRVVFRPPTVPASSHTYSL